MKTVLERVKAQIEAGKDELPDRTRSGVDWWHRCTRTAEELVPWLQGSAPDLIEYMEGVLGAPQKVRGMWTEIKPVRNGSWTRPRPNSP